MRRGVCKIVSNDKASEPGGAGVYTVTERIFDAADDWTWSDASAEPRLLNARAHDVNNCPTGYAGQIVPFFQVVDARGEVETIIDVSGSSATVLMQISGSTAIGAANTGPGSSTVEWTYSADEVTESVSTSGVLSYATVSGGVSLTNKLINLRETGNRSVSSGGTYGNGVAYDDLDDATITGKLAPIPTNCVVEARLLYDSTGALWGSFAEPNAVQDITCD